MGDKYWDTSWDLDTWYAAFYIAYTLENLIFLKIQRQQKIGKWFSSSLAMWRSPAYYWVDHLVTPDLSLSLSYSVYGLNLPKNEDKRLAWKRQKREKKTTSHYAQEGLFLSGPGHGSTPTTSGIKTCGGLAFVFMYLQWVYNLTNWTVKYQKKNLSQGPVSLLYTTLILYQNKNLLWQQLR